MVKFNFDKFGRDFEKVAIDKLKKLVSEFGTPEEQSSAEYSYNKETGQANVKNLSEETQAKIKNS